MSRRARAWAVGAAFTALFLWLALRSVDPAELVRTLGQLRWYDLLPLAGIVLLDVLLRAVRWRLLLPRGPKATTARLFRLELIGLAVNNVLPLRLGELARAALAAKELELPIVAVLSSIVLERLLDMLALLALLAYAADPAAVPGLAGAVGWARAGFWLLVAGLAALAWLEHAEPPRLPRFPAVQRFLAQLLLGLRALRDPRTAAAVAALALGLWLMNAGGFYYGAVAFRIPQASYGLGVSALLAGAAGAALPAVPGYFGTWEFAVSGVMTRAGADPGTALAMAGLIHVLQYSVVTALGLAALWREGSTLSGLAGSLERKG